MRDERKKMKEEKQYIGQQCWFHSLIQQNLSFIHSLLIFFIVFMWSWYNAFVCVQMRNEKILIKVRIIIFWYHEKKSCVGRDCTIIIPWHIKWKSSKSCIRSQEKKWNERRKNFKFVPINFIAVIIIISNNNMNDRNFASFSRNRQQQQQQLKWSIQATWGCILYDVRIYKKRKRKNLWHYHSECVREPMKHRRWMENSYNVPNLPNQHFEWVNNLLWCLPFR